MRFTAAVGAIVVLTLCPGVGPAAAGETRRMRTAPDAESLDRAIESVLQRREYRWRMPREVEAQQEDKSRGPIASFFNWLVESVLKPLWNWIGEGAASVGELVRKFIEWLESLIPRSPPPSSEGSAGWMTTVRLMLIVVLSLLAVALAYGLGRLLKRKQPPSVKAGAAVETDTPDLEQEGLSADELTADRWLGLAREMIEKDDLRLAMRALYLATLASLSERGLITAGFFKSNLEYKRELERRVHGVSGLCSAFSDSISAFERVWYGLKTVSRPELDEYAALQERIIGMAES